MLLFAHPVGVQLRSLSFSHHLAIPLSSLPDIPFSFSFSPQTTHKTGNHNSARSSGDSAALKLRPQDAFVTTWFSFSNRTRVHTIFLLPQIAPVVGDPTIVALGWSCRGRPVKPCEDFLKSLLRPETPPRGPTSGTRACPVRAACLRRRSRSRSPWALTRGVRPAHPTATPLPVVCGRVQLLVRGSSGTVRAGGDWLTRWLRIGPEKRGERAESALGRCWAPLR